MVVLGVFGSVPALPARPREGPLPVRAAETHALLDAGAMVDLPLVASHVAVHWAGNPHARVTVSFSSNGETFGAESLIVPDEAGRGTETETYGGVMPAANARAIRLTSDQTAGPRDGRRDRRCVAGGWFVGCGECRGGAAERDFAGRLGGRRGAAL